MTTEFQTHRVEGHDGVHLNVSIGGSGTPVVLLHGFPQTHLCWRHVAADLAQDHTVIAPDLRGYGDSDKPEDTGETYSKRTMPPTWSRWPRTWASGASRWPIDL